MLTISNCKYLFTNIFIFTEKLRYSNLHIQILIHCNINTNAGRHYIYYINFFDFQSSVWPKAPLVTEGGWKYTTMANGEQYARTTSNASKQLSSAKCWGCKYHVNLASEKTNFFSLHIIYISDKIIKNEGVGSEFQYLKPV